MARLWRLQKMRKGSAKNKNKMLTAIILSSKFTPLERVKKFENPEKSTL